MKKSSIFSFEFKKWCQKWCQNGAFKINYIY